MRVSELIPEGENTWTNDTGLPVEVNPPGIVVQVGQSIEIDEHGSVHLKKIEPKTEPVAAAEPEEPAEAEEPRSRRRYR